MENQLPFDDAQPPKANLTDKEVIKQLHQLLEASKKDNDKLRQENVELKNFKEEKLKYRPDKTFGLNVCGDVMLNKMEVEIVNTPAFKG